MALSIVTAAKRRNVLGYKHLEKIGNGPQSAMADFLKFLAKRDVVFEVDDFAYGTMASTFWTANGGTGATAFAVPATQLVGGVVSGVTGTNGTASNRITNLYGNLVWSGNKHCGMEVRFKLSAVTAVAAFAGFIDTYTTLTTAQSVVQDIDTPSFASGLGDAAVVGFDTTQTLATMALATVGSTPYSAAKTTIGTLIPTAATYFTVRIQLNGDDVYAAVEDGNGSYLEVNKTAGINGATLVRPYLDLAATTATSRTMDVDYIARWMER